MRIYTVLRIFVCFVPFFASAQIYEYPIHPGIEQWNNLQTEEERFNAIEIPKELLDTMSTSDLMITCMNYPAIIYITAFNSIQQGMNHIVHRFNGLQELLRRKDAPNLLLLTYQSMNSTSTYFPNPEVSKKLWFIRRCYFELIIGQPEIICNMDATARLNLMVETRKRLDTKINGKHHYSPLDIQTTLLIMARVLNQSGYSKFQNELEKKGSKIKIAMETGTFRNQETVNAIIELSDMYIKENQNL